MNRIKELRESIPNLSQTKLGKKLNVHQTAISQWETGRTTPDIETSKALANFFGVSLDYLLGNDTENSNPPRRIGVKIPVLGNVAAGMPITAIENIDYDDPNAWEEIPAEMAESGEYFALRLKGDSMEPRMLDGDVVIVHEQSDVNSGDTAIVKVNGEDATCKKIKKTSQGMMLIPLNPEYEPLFFTNKEVQTIPVEIIGKVVELRGKFR